MNDTISAKAAAASALCAKAARKAHELAPKERTLRPVRAQVRSIDTKARTIEFVASTEAVDRYGDIIRVDGWQLDNYRKNPVFLWAHRSSDPPIGKCVAIGAEGEGEGKALVQRIEFAAREAYPFAETIFKLYEGGFLNAVSVGFMPIKYQPRIEPNEEGGEFLGYEFLEQELFELSAVPVPANPEALGKAVRKGIISVSEMDEMKRRGWYGEDNPPRAFMAPGVTYPENRPADQEDVTDSSAQVFNAKHFEDVPGTGKAASQESAWERVTLSNPSRVERDIEEAAQRERPSKTLKTFCDEGRDLAREIDARLSDLERRVRDIQQSQSAARESFDKLFTILQSRANHDCPEGEDCPKQGDEPCPKGEDCPMKGKAAKCSEDGGASQATPSEATASAPDPKTEAVVISTVEELLAALTAKQ